MELNQWLLNQMLWFSTNCKEIIDITAVSSVNCGQHSADNCHECPNGNGEIWCNGDCAWIKDKCIPVRSVSLGT